MSNPSDREYPVTRTELKAEIDEFEKLYGRKPVILAPDILLLVWEEWGKQQKRLPYNSNPVEVRRDKFAKITVFGCKLHVGAETYGLE